MTCIICNKPTNFFLSKSTFKEEYMKMIENIGSFEYFKCTNCGFTISKTHTELSSEKWLKLNFDFHHYIENNDAPINQPPYFEQAFIIKLLVSNEIISINNSIDYAGGYGTLSKILNEYFNLKLKIYDPYITNNDNTIEYVPTDRLSRYNTLFNSALFEHLFTREAFDKINNLITDDGCMILHTVVCENIPNDPNWFYMAPPVHCAFHTNKSMKILMEQWGFESSIYSPKAKSWILFKNEPLDLIKKIKAINTQFQSEIFLYKKGFLDYWKGF